MGFNSGFKGLMAVKQRDGNCHRMYERLNYFLVGNTIRLTDHEKNSDSQDKHLQIYRTLFCFLRDIGNGKAQ